MTAAITYAVHILTAIVHYLYFFAKIYRLLCFARITFDQLPLFNPYKWPLSFVRLVTKPYFDLCHRAIPNMKIRGRSLNISSIVAFELMASIITLLKTIRIALAAQLETVDSVSI